jgi:hypothetical protein
MLVSHALHVVKNMVMLTNTTIFDFRDQLIQDYAPYIHCFIQIRDKDIKAFVEGKRHEGVPWPEPLIHLNPLFEQEERIDQFVVQGILHRACVRIFHKTSRKYDCWRGEASTSRLANEDMVRTRSYPRSLADRDGPEPGMLFQRSLRHVRSRANACASGLGAR